MAVDNLKLAMALRLADKVSPQAKKISGVNKVLAGRLKETQRAMAMVNKQAGQVRSLQTLKSRLGESAQKLDAAQQKMKGLVNEMHQARKAGKSTTALAKKIDAANRSVHRLSDSHTGLRKKVGAATRKLKAAGIDTRNLNQASNNLDNRIRGLNRRLERHKWLLGMSGKASEKLSKGWGRIKSGSKWLAGGLVATGLATMPLINTASQFENFETVLTTIEGSSAKAKKSMEWVSNFAAKTPYDLAQVNDAFVRLKSYGLDPTNGLLRTLGDTSSSMGKPMMAAVEAISDAVTGENERLKEFGITASTQGDLVTYTYTDKKGVQKTVSAIKGNRAQIQKALTGIWDEKFAGGMDKSSRTWTGIVSNLMDYWTRFQKMVMDSGPFQRLKGHLSALLVKLDAMSQNGELQAWAERVGSVILRIIDGAGTLGGRLWELTQTVTPMAQAVADFTGGWGHLGAVLGGAKLLGGFEGVGKALLWIGRIAMAHPLLALVGLLAAGAMLIIKNWDAVTGAFSKAINWIKSIIPDWMVKLFNHSPIGMVINMIRSLTSGGSESNSADSGGGTAAGGNVIKAAGGRNVTNNNSSTINVYAQPGMDEQALAQQVKSEIERNQREQAAQNRGALHD